MSSPPGPDRRRIPPATQAPRNTALNPAFIRQDTANTLALAQQTLDLARAAIRGYLSQHLQACDLTRKECRDSLRAQLDASVKYAWDTYVNVRKDLHNQLAYLMSEATQYAAILGYGQQQVSVPTYAPASDLVERNIDYLHTGIGPKDQSIVPGRFAVGPRSDNPAVQTTLDIDPRNPAQFIDVSPEPYRLPQVTGISLGPGVYTPEYVARQPDATVAIHSAQPVQATMQPVVAPQQVVVPAVPLPVPSLATPVSLLGQPTEPETIAEQMRTFAGRSVSQGVTLPSGAVLRRGPQISPLTGVAPVAPTTQPGTQSNPWTYASAGGNDWPLVKPGDWINVTGGLYQAYSCGTLPPTGWTAGPRLSETMCTYAPPTDQVLPVAGEGKPGQAPVVPPEACPDPRENMDGWTPWQRANCPSTPRAAEPSVTPGSAVPVGPCPTVNFDVSALCNCIASSLAELTLAPVDLDQPIAWRWAPDDLPWKAQAIAWGGKWLDLYSSSPTAASFQALIDAEILAPTPEEL